MPAKFDLATLQALALVGGYGGRANLEGASAILALSAAQYLANLEMWRGAGDFLTPEETDIIDSMIAQLESDLMFAGESFAMDMCKVTRSVDQSVLDNTLTYLDFDVDVYDPEEMHSTVVLPKNIYVINPGLHLVHARFRWQFHTTGARILYLYHYNSLIPQAIQVAREQEGVTSQDGAKILSATSHVDCVVGDYFFVAVKQTSGGALNVEVTEYSPNLAVVRL